MLDIVIIDVGAHADGTDGKSRKRETGYPVIYFEPDFDPFSRLQISPNDIKLPMIVGSRDGVMPFHFYQDGTHSVLETNLEQINQYVDGFTGNPARVEDWTARCTMFLPSIRLDTLMRQMNIRKVDHLKIDAQGYDFEVIKSLGHRISDVRSIKCEVQITKVEVYKGQSKKEELVSFMERNNFYINNIDTQTYGQEENITFINNAFKLV
jgi:FkbM family methyltransferase